MRCTDLAVTLRRNAPAGKISVRGYDRCNMSVGDLDDLRALCGLADLEKHRARLYCGKHRRAVGVQPTEGEACTVKPVAGNNGELTCRDGI